MEQKADRLDVRSLRIIWAMMPFGVKRFEPSLRDPAIGEVQVGNLQRKACRYGLGQGR